MDENRARLASLAARSRFEAFDWVSETGSTNADLMASAIDLDQPEQVLVADYQTAGRGRRDRIWNSEPGASLMMSLLIRPDVPIREAHRFTTALGLAARSACESLSDTSPQLKWPNDLVCGSKKLAGILAESALEGDRLIGLVLGIGINVSLDPTLPAEVQERATSLQAEAGTSRALDRVDLAAEIVQHFSALAEESPESLRRMHIEHSSTVGSEVRVEEAGGNTTSGVLVGLATDVDVHGHLIVESGGRRHELTVGDVTNVRTP